MSTLSQYQATCWFVIKNNEILVLRDSHALLDASDIIFLEVHFLRYFQLGSVNNIEYHCAELDAHAPTPENFTTLSLRSVLSLLNSAQYGMGVKAYSVITWDKNHQFCGRCGAPTIHDSKGFERICSACTLSFFPRISPSIIVLIKKNDHLLMARSPHFLPGVYGLIAGFVEIGESLEETVHREVKEEVGLEITNLSYFGSQAWPFPDSLMVGFMADYASGDILIDNNEIEDANWYKYDNLPGRPSLSISIASQLLDSFVNLWSQKKENKHV